jgi:Nuclease A inhibitor-like protein
VPTAAAIAALAEAAAGLTYQSETDAPFEPVVWRKADGRLTKGKLRKRVGKAAGPVREVPLDEFFADLTAGQTWHGEREQAAADRYRNLLDVVRTRLADVRVFKVGGPRVDVYVVGTTDEGDWAGLKTTAVET